MQSSEVEVLSEPNILRNLVSTISVNTASLYNKTKASSTTLNDNLSKIERRLEPYTENLLKKTDPLISIVDTRLNQISEKVTPTVKTCVEQVNTTLVQPSEKVIKGSVEYASARITETKENIQKRRKDVIERVSSTEKYLYKLKDDAITVASTKKERVQTKTQEVYGSVLGLADRAVDKFLPDEDEFCHSKGSVDLTCKVGSRLRRRADGVLRYSSERAKSIVHVDLIQYAKDISHVDDKRVAEAFDRVIARLPNPTTTTKYSETILQHTPTVIKPVVAKGVSLTTPVVDTAFLSVIAVCNFIRNRAFEPSPAPVTDRTVDSDDASVHNPQSDDATAALEPETFEVRDEDELPPLISEEPVVVYEEAGPADLVEESEFPVSPSLDSAAIEALIDDESVQTETQLAEARDSKKRSKKSKKHHGQE